ncbi:hypothetical protein BDQ17DRAFT_948971 [Cyathus striatus]|nr:hypothetical protein BDQ17DRAFT_948971 [Cyathus striatus]
MDGEAMITPCNDEDKRSAATPPHHSALETSYAVVSSGTTCAALDGFRPWAPPDTTSIVSDMEGGIVAAGSPNRDTEDTSSKRALTGGKIHSCTGTCMLSRPC